MTILSVEQVSDGMLVHFLNGTTCYYPAEVLLKLVGQGGTQVFVHHDPTELSLLRSHDAASEAMVH